MKFYYISAIHFTLPSFLVELESRTYTLSSSLAHDGLRPSPTGIDRWSFTNLIRLRLCLSPCPLVYQDF